MPKCDFNISSCFATLLNSDFGMGVILSKNTFGGHLLKQLKT